MNKSDYDKYYQTGGSYIIPVEVFNELFDEMVSWRSEVKNIKYNISEIIDYIYKNGGFYYDSDEGVVPNYLGMYEVAHITGELNKLINDGSD